MTCAVASSPVFSPPRVSSLFCKTSSSSSPETLSLKHHGLPSSSSSSRSPSASSSPSSPFRLRLQKPFSGFRACKKEGFSASSSSSAPLNRKRPARIDIPAASLGFSAATPVQAAEGRRDMEFERDEFSVFCKRGRREVMEDRYSATCELQGDPKQAIFGIYDGHGGALAAEFAAENLDKNIVDEVRRTASKEEIVEAVKSGYLITDSQFLKSDARGGTCCVTALIRKGDLIVSNAGDCRAVLSRGGVAEALTSDHRPSREDEKKRIQNLGGYVDSCHGVWRLQGCLAVSRGIGDRHLKQWVNADPETKILRIERNCEFLILASDGLWDKVSNQEAVDIARPFCIGIDKPELLLACKKLANLSVMRGCSDDTSVMVIRLGCFT